MGRKGRQRATEYFGRDTIVDQYEDLYRELVLAPVAAVK
jgi:hypothetical protein